MSYKQPAPQFLTWYQKASENEKVDWLIATFNHTFAHKHTLLVRSNLTTGGEPEYFPPTFTEDGKLLSAAKIAFAHGFFASALHEISHWCIAGKQRRLLPDFGYWYEPDGRTAEQQRQFEQVEVKPQAIEWLFTQATLGKFRISVDNLNGESTDSSAFKHKVWQQAQNYVSGKEKLPPDAAVWLTVLLSFCRVSAPLTCSEFQLANI